MSGHRSAIGKQSGARRSRFAVMRKSAGFTQEGLAEALGVDRTTIVRWERGETEPQPWQWPRLAKALCVPPDKLASVFTEFDGRGATVENLRADAGAASSAFANPENGSGTGKATGMPYAKTSLRGEKRKLREQMRAEGLDYRQIAAEFSRLYRLRPRAAWRDAYGWSLQETADKINVHRGDIGLDPAGLSGMTAAHLCEHENWPGYGEGPTGRKPSPYLLAVLASIYDCQVSDLIDLADRRHFPKADLLVVDSYSRNRNHVQPPAAAWQEIRQFAVPAEQIEISPSLAVISGCSSPAGGEACADSLEVNDVERRELLKLMGGMALAAPLAGGVDANALRREMDSALNAPTANSDVEEWERVTAQYSMESGMLPPALLLPELLSDLDEALVRLKGSPAALRAPMARVCGYLSALAAANFFNAGNERNARRYWRTAMRLIDQSGDRPAQAELHADRASFALLETLSSPSTALALADDAISISGKIPCAGTVSAHGTRAMALALLGDHSASASAAQDLGDSYTRMPEATNSAHSAWGFSEQQLHFIEGHVHAYAGRASDSAKALDAGISMVPAGQWIAVSSFEVNRAICMIRAGDPSEGARHVVRAIQALPAGYRRSATMRRASAALDMIPVGADNVPAVVEARELLRSGA